MIDISTIFPWDAIGVAWALAGVLGDPLTTLSLPLISPADAAICLAGEFPATRLIYC
jgi:hypothetical protein